MNVLLSAIVAVALTGKIAVFDYLIGGTWGCAIKLPAVHGRPPQIDHAKVTFEVTPGDAFRGHQSTAEYAADSYYGYSSKSNRYWIATVDSTGAYRYATSPDGKTFTRVSSSYGSGINVKATYTKVSSNELTVREVLSGYGREGIVNTVCTR